MKILHTHRDASASGFTLVELLVVLTILALLAGTAVTMTNGVVEQARYEATIRTLDDLERAILGEAGQRGAGGMPWITGFVADIGRLPELRESADGTRLELEELWTPPELWAIPGATFSLQSPAEDGSVRLGAGWRGPYLRLPLGAQELRDGWGKHFVFRDADGNASVAGTSPAMIVSLGADGAEGPGSGPYDEDLVLVLARSAPLVPPRHLGDVPVRLEYEGSDTVVVRLYAPEHGSVRALLPDSEDGGVMTFRTVPVGPRVLRAYTQTSDPPLQPVSRPINFTVVAGGVPEIVIEISSEEE